jgi:hypothetical protein
MWDRLHIPVTLLGGTGFTGYKICTVECNTLKVTPWDRGSPEKLTGPQLLTKFPAFYGTRTLITAFTTSHQLSLPWARSIQSTRHPTSLKSILTVSTSHIHFPMFRLYRRVNPFPRLLGLVRNMVEFLRWGVVSTTPNPQVGGRPLVGCPLLLNIFVSKPPPPPPQLQAVPISATWGRAMPWWQGPTYRGI